jgi:hypothetical protein
MPSIWRAFGHSGFSVFALAGLDVLSELDYVLHGRGRNYHVRDFGQAWVDLKRVLEQAAGILTWWNHLRPTLVVQEAFPRLKKNRLSSRRFFYRNRWVV